MADARSAVTLDLQGLQGLLDVLRHMGFTVLGPTVRNGAVVPGRLSSVDDLPRGWGDLQEPGSYRLRRRDDEALFGYAADAVSWKSVLFPSRELIWAGQQSRRTGSASTPLRAERTVTLATRRTPSSAFGLATCTRSRSTTGCCGTGPTRTRVTRPGERTHSSSPWSAPIRAGRASASPWAPVPGRSRATTSR